MSSTSAFNFRLALSLFISCFNLVFAQTEMDEGIKTNDSGIVRISEKTVVFTAGTFQPIAIDNSNFGRVAEANLGFKLGLQFFVYKNFFVSGFFSASYFDIQNQDLVGRYYKSTLSSTYLQLGYEQKINSKLLIGASIAPLGFATYKNIIDRSRIEQQKDRAYINNVEIYISYEVLNNIAIYVDYAFRSDKTYVETAPEILNKFNRIQYHNIGFGLRFFGGHKNRIVNF